VTARGLAFLAEASESPFSQEAAYWLVVGAAPGKRVLLPPTPMRALRWEPDEIYQPVARSARGDRWYAAELRNSGVTPVRLGLPAPLPAGAIIVLDVAPLELRAEHRVALWVGGVRLGGAAWGDLQSGPRRIAVRTELALPAGPAALSITLETDAPDLVLLDGLEIADARIPLPTVTPALERPRAAPQIVASDQQIIAHPDLIGGLAPLIDAKQSLGRSAAVADVLAIYDAYSWGERDPEAIRAFLLDLAQHGVQPASALLVGAGTARLRYGPGAHDPTRIPPYLIDGDPAYGEIACDSCFARLGAQDPRSALPALPLGRLPARTPEEIATLAAKTALALVGPAPGIWRGRVLLVADNDHDLDGGADPAGPFVPLLDLAAAQLPGAPVEQFRYAPGAPDGVGSYSHAAPLRERLLAAWDAGAGLVIYAGHASPWQWAWTGAQEPVPYLLAHIDAVRANAGRLPILISLSCLSGSFANPTMATLDEALLLQPGGGIVAALSPSGSGDHRGHQELIRALAPALAAGRSLGEAHLASARALAHSPEHQSLAYGYAILGDPEVGLPLAREEHRAMLPLVVRPGGDG
jgi:Peptidase family C25